jgi:hypothetical protein
MDDEGVGEIVDKSSSTFGNMNETAASAVRDCETTMTISEVVNALANRIFGVLRRAATV